jgi:ABC-type bacteriocin/lantibiotic exporter with double-glycine peptidase domain
VKRIALCFVVAALTNPSSGADSDDKKLCGARTVYLAGESLTPGSMGGLENVISDLSPGDDGNSFAEMADALENRGFKTLAVQTTLEGLMTRKRPFACIAHLIRGHFVVIADANDVEVVLYDPPRNVTLPINTFESQWSGKCLLVSNSQLEDEELIQESLRGTSGMWMIASGVIVVLVVFAMRFRRTTAS